MDDPDSRPRSNALHYAYTPTAIGVARSLRPSRPRLARPGSAAHRRARRHRHSGVPASKLLLVFLGGPLGCPRPSSRLTSWLDPFACSKTSCYYSTGSEKPHRCCHRENTVKYVEFNDCRQVWTCLSMSIQNCLFPLGDPAPT